MNDKKKQNTKLFVPFGDTHIFQHDNTPDTNYDNEYKLKDGTYVIPTDGGSNWVYQQGGGFVASGQYIFYVSNGQPVTDNSGQYLITGLDGVPEWTSTPPSSQEQHETSNPAQSIGGQSTTKSAKKADVQPDNPNTASGGGSVPSAITDAISKLENEMQTVQGDVSTDQKDIATNTQDIKSLTSEVGTLKSDVGNDVSELASAQGTIKSDKATIAEQQATITSQSNQLGQNQTQLNQDKLEIEHLQGSNAAGMGAITYQNNQIKQLQAQVAQLQQQNQTLLNKYTAKKEIVVEPNTTVSPVTTILSVQTFKQFTTNYYLSGVGENGYYTASTLKRMQSIISNVEVNLNAMLNGRLYERYTPGAVIFKGWGNLSPQLEEQTLYQCLTECVEYRLITQQYVNLTNSYSGTINGANNYQTQNNNVIGLRQDIQAKLSLLGLYANVLIGKKQPKSTEYQIEHDGFNAINFGNLQQWYGFIQNTPWNFTKPISFQGGMTFGGNVSFTSNVNFTNSISVPTVSGTNASFTKEVQAGSLVGNSLTLKLPYAPLLNFVNMTAPSLATSKIFFGVQNTPTTSSSSNPSKTVAQGKTSLFAKSPGQEFWTPDGKTHLVIISHGTTDMVYTLNAQGDMDQAYTGYIYYYPENGNKIVPYTSNEGYAKAVNGELEWTNLPPSDLTTVPNLIPQPPLNYEPLNEFDVYASTINLWGTQLNVGGNMTCAGKTTLSDVSVNGALTFGAQSTPTFENGITVSPSLTINGTITQNMHGNDEVNVFNSPVNMNNNLNVMGKLYANDGMTLPIWGFNPYFGGNNLNPTNVIALNTSTVADPMALFANFLNPNVLWVHQTPYSVLTNELGTVNAQVISGLGVNNFLVEQYVYDVYDLNQASAIPGYMAPLNDGDTYIDLEKLFLNTFGQGDLTNGYSYTFQVDWQQNLGLSLNSATPYTLRNVEVLNTEFFVYNTSQDMRILNGNPQQYSVNNYQLRKSYCSYHGNPFPNGTITRVMQAPGQFPQNSLVRFRIEVPSAVDNRQPDDSMFLHGAINVSVGGGLGQYLVCVFLVRYIFGLTPMNI